MSAALEAGGIGLTVFDIRRAQLRLSAYLSRPLKVYSSDAGAIGEAFNAHALTSEAKTLEQRVEALEAWRRTLPTDLDQRDERTRTRLETAFQSDLTATRQSLRDQLDGMREYVAGSKQSFWGMYRGPIALLIGVLVGTAANFVALG
ncbi:hypothetical protein [Streptomyces cylindrosporus]|uniref:Uncharacterized protein n=1 Tax=Streptomyces cylindrosporus TaxID=2927583 RepID=A0ABS9YBH5_9ACTN|nr:hypothetical protein [Streptomyces cylindrosporus]MCI3274567.1 hypothetical protein [Streptomyces cylindrosporus]